MHKRFFITGTDTEVGKTTISCLLLQHWNKQGFSTAGLKPVATGAILKNGLWQSEDALQLKKASSYLLEDREINPFLFKPPVSPNIASQDEQQILNVEKINDAIQPILKKPIDILLVEGIGGFMVPLNTFETMSDVAVCLNFPIILVVSIKLGALNHALLTQKAIHETGLKFQGWIGNCMDLQLPFLEENIQTLKIHLKAPCLGIIKNLEKYFIEEKYL